MVLLSESRVEAVQLVETWVRHTEQKMGLISLFWGRAWTGSLSTTYREKETDIIRLGQLRSGEFDGRLRGDDGIDGQLCGYDGT